MSQSIKYVLFILLLAFQCVYWGLETRPLNKTQELRVAETAREMVASGDWVTPRYNGSVRVRKPPLAYWLTAASYIAWDRVTEFTARFASATLAVCTALLLFWWLRRTLDDEAALAATICLLSSYLALRFLRSAETDAILIFFVTAACIVLYRLLAEGYTHARALLLHALMGLGFLAKGPAAIAIPLALGTAYAIKRESWRPLRPFAHPAGLLLLVVLAFGWYVAIYTLHTDTAAYWIAKEIDVTYGSGGDHRNPVYWYLSGVFAFFAPWSLFIFPAAAWFYRTRPLPPFVTFAAAWLGLSFLMLSLNPAKQPQYALLLNPPLAILLGYYLVTARGVFAKLNTWMLGLILIASTIAAAIYLMKGPWSVDARGVLVIAAMTALPAAAAWILRIELRRHGLPILLAGLMSALWIHGLTQLYGPQSEEAADKRFALAVKDYAPLYVYGDANVAIGFYAGKVVPLLEHSETLTEVLNNATAEIYVVGSTDNPVPQGPDAKAVHSDGKLVLWRMENQP